MSLRPPNRGPSVACVSSAITASRCARRSSPWWKRMTKCGVRTVWKRSRGSYRAAASALDASRPRRSGTMVNLMAARRRDVIATRRRLKRARGSNRTATAFSPGVLLQVDQQRQGLQRREPIRVNGPQAFRKATVGGRFSLEESKLLLWLVGGGVQRGTPPAAQLVTFEAHEDVAGAAHDTGGQSCKTRHLN